MRLLRYVLKRLLVVAAGSYLALSGVVIFSQRSLIFHPAKIGSETPANYGVPFEKVSIPVPGTGGSVAAWWNRYQDSEPRPTVIYCHGNGASLSAFGKVSQIFHGMGWNALLFDYRGYGESSDPAEGLSEESTARDAEAAYRWLLTKVPESTVVIWGHSLGSSIAARLSRGKSPAGLILEGAFPSMFDMAHDRYPYLPIMGFMIFDKFETADYIRDRHFPLLSIHAENDRVIPLQYGKALYEQTGAPKEWLLLTGIGHNDFPSVHQQYDGQIAGTVASWIAARKTVASGASGGQ